MSGVDELLERVRARRSLPPAAERKKIRKAAGLSLRDVGVALGVSHTAVRGWERGVVPRDHRAAYGALLDELRRMTAA